MIPDAHAEQHHGQDGPCEAACEHRTYRAQGDSAKEALLIFQLPRAINLFLLVNARIKLLSSAVSSQKAYILAIAYHADQMRIGRLLTPFKELWRTSCEFSIMLSKV